MENHDLSYNVATIDYKTLLNVIETACGNAKRRVDHYIKYYDLNTMDFKFANAYHASRNLAKASNDLKLAMETYYTLTELAERENLIITNLDKTVITEKDQSNLYPEGD